MPNVDTQRSDASASRSYAREVATFGTQIKRAFTLIELLIVIVLFSAGAVALLQIFSTTLYGGSENQNTLIATALAEEKMEKIRNTAYGSVVDEARAAVPDHTFFEREVAVDDDTPVTGIKQVTVNVYWVEGLAEATISLVTYVSDI